MRRALLVVAVVLGVLPFLFVNALIIAATIALLSRWIWQLL